MPRPPPCPTAGWAGTASPLPLSSQAGRSEQARSPDLPAARALRRARRHRLRDRRLGGNQRYLPQAAPARVSPAMASPAHGIPLPAASLYPWHPPSMPFSCPRHSPATAFPCPQHPLPTISPFHSIPLPVTSPVRASPHQQHSPARNIPRPSYPPVRCTPGEGTPLAKASPSTLRVPHPQHPPTHSIPLPRHPPARCPACSLPAGTADGSVLNVARLPVLAHGECNAALRGRLKESELCTAPLRAGVGACEVSRAPGPPPQRAHGCQHRG